MKRLSLDGLLEGALTDKVDRLLGILEVCLLGIGVRRRCLVIVVIFMGFERVKRWEDILSS